MRLDLAARVCESTLHWSREQTDTAATTRLSFYSVQLVSVLVLIAMAALA